MRPPVVVVAPAGLQEVELWWGEQAGAGGTAADSLLGAGIARDVRDPEDIQGVLVRECYLYYHT